jgi:hypothetical protein
VRDFAQKEIAPRSREIDTGERIPQEIIKGMADLTCPEGCDILVSRCSGLNAWSLGGGWHGGKW